MSSKLGYTLEPNRINPEIIGGTSFAEGGSRVSKSWGELPAPFDQFTAIPITTQVDRLLAQSPNLRANDLVLLWAGANDGFANFETYKDSPDPSPGLQAMAAEASILATQVSRLKSAGAKLVVVLTVPNLANTPLANDPDLAHDKLTGTLTTGESLTANPDYKALYTALSSSFNAELLKTAPQAGALVIDIDKVLTDAIQNPAKYGFNSDVYGTACDDISLWSICDNSENYLFADFVHPSVKAHQMLAEFIYASLQAIPQAQTLLTAPLQNIRQQSLSVENRLNMQALSDSTGKLREVGDVHVYGGPEGGYMKTSGQQLLSSVESTSANVDLGVDWMVTRNAVVGVALSYGEMNTKFGGQSGQLKTNNTVGTLYATVALDQNWFINASASYGDINHTDFTRQLMLPTTTVKATSSPGGYYASGRIGLGWNGKIGNGSGGPYVSYTAEKITTNGFTENESPMSMSFGDMSYTAQRVSAGAFWMQDQVVGKVGVFGRAAVDYDLNSNDITVKLGPNPQALTSVDVARLPQTTINGTIGLMLPTSKSSLWTLQASAGGADGFQAYSVGLFFRHAF